MARKKHPIKEIEEALRYAEAHGWSIEVKKKGHAWGIMRCSRNDSVCWNGIYCSTSIWSTPKNSHNHARVIRNIVDKCIYKVSEGKEDE